MIARNAFKNALVVLACTISFSEAFLGPSSRLCRGVQVTRPPDLPQKYYVHASVVAPFNIHQSSDSGGAAAVDDQQPNEMSRQTTSEFQEKPDEDLSILQTLCGLLDAKPPDLLRFDSTSDGVRGIYLSRPLQKEDVILSIPLTSCLQDASPPSWLKAEDVEEETAYSQSQWAIRLAAGLLHLKLVRKSAIDEGRSLWLSCLPDEKHLRASLPVHWPEETVESARSTTLELAVDSAYFSRAEAVEDLVFAMKSNIPDIVSEMQEIELRAMCNAALDIVQTRSCRVDQGSENEPLRLLAPIFDFINHGSIRVVGDTGANASFQLEGDHLVVRAIRDIDADDEVLIDYGDSARPAWRCLLSYGFVPQYTRIPGPHEEASTDTENEDNAAEIYMDGVRYVVGPSQVPFDMVAAAFNSDHPIDDDESDLGVSLTPEVALKLARRISDIAHYLLLEQDRDSLSVNDDDDEEEASRAVTTFDIISRRQAAALRWSQHRVLMACALGLREYAEENGGIE